MTLKTWAYLLGGATVLTTLFGKALASSASGGSSATMTEVQRKAFLIRVLNAISSVLPSASLDAKILILTQATYESGWGSGTAYRLGYNAFNITRPAGSTLPMIRAGDTECNDDNVCKPISQNFAKYGSVEESVRHYLSFIQGSRYSNAYSLLMNGNIAFLGALSIGGYFTQPLSIYMKNFTDVRASVVKRLVGSVPGLRA